MIGLILALALGGVHYDTSIGSCMPLSGGTFGDDISVCYGDAPDYCLVYDSTATAFEIWSTDTDGAGADGNVCIINDGGDDLACAGTITGATLTDGGLTCTSGTCTGGVSITSAIVVAGTAADVADSGVVRIDNAESICWEAAPAGTDECLTVDASEVLTYTGSITATGGTVTGTTLTDGTLTCTAGTCTGGVAFTASAITATGYFQANVGAGGVLYLTRDAAPGSNDTLGGAVYYRGYDSGSTATVFAQTEGYTEEVTDTDEDGSYTISVMDNGSVTAYIKADGSDGVEAVTRSKGLIEPAITNPGDSDYTALDSDLWITMGTTCTASRTITLDDDQCQNGRVYTITDTGCGAAANNIVIDPEGTSLINGTASGTVSLTTDDESITVKCLDGSGAAGAKSWWVI